MPVFQEGVMSIAEFDEEDQDFLAWLRDKFAEEYEENEDEE